MSEVTEIEDYREKWLEAERDIAINCWIEDLYIAVKHEPVDEVDEKIGPAEMPIV